MHRINSSELYALVESIYRGVGVPSGEAEIVARHQVEADLAGHASHGVSRTRRYVNLIERKLIVPGAPYVVERESSATAVVDGNWGFGFVVTGRCVDLALAKAKESGVAAITIRRQSHIGRLGAYAERIANSNMIGLLTADSGMGPKHVAPFGGRESRLGTNPICFGIPGGPGGSIIVDMATAAVAGGKIEMARRRGEQLPRGWILNSAGKPSTDPADYYKGGTLLPLGGDQGHKGYALSFAVEVLCGLLTGLGFGLDPEGRQNDGVFLAVFDVSFFRDSQWFKSTVGDFVGYLKETPLAQGHTEILYPGEIEYRTARLRERTGIELDDQTWEELQELSRGQVAPKR